MRFADLRSETSVTEYHPRTHDREAWNERIKALQEKYAWMRRDARIGRSKGGRPKRKIYGTNIITGEKREWIGGRHCADELYIAEATVGTLLHRGKPSGDGWVLSYQKLEQ